MIMIVGLPGVGKTTWGINMQKSHPDKRYNIIGTDTLIDKMRVMGLPRKRNYAGRWEVLIDKSTKCLNKLFTLAAKRKRNYILDQTNVYGSARRRKMKNFTGFFRVAAVIQTDDHELERRSKKRTQEDGKVVPESAVLEMKANFSLPEDRDNLFDRIDYVELPKDLVGQLVRQYNSEGKSKPRHDSSQSRFDNKKHGDQSQHYGGYPGQSFGGRSGSAFDGRPGDPMAIKMDPWEQEEPQSKRIKSDPSSALDLLKQQYEEEDRSQPSSQAVSMAIRAGWPDLGKVKDEVGLGAAGVASTQWPSSAGLPPGYAQGLIPSHAAALQPGLLGAPPIPHGVQLAFLPPGMPPPPPSELAGLGLTAAKLGQDQQAQQAAHVHVQAQLAQAQAAAVAQSQILVDPSRLTAGSPYALVSQATGQSLYGAAGPSGFEAVMAHDQNRQIWQQAAEQAQAAQIQAVQQQQQQQSWQQEQGEMGQKSQLSKPWQHQDKSAGGGGGGGGWQQSEWSSQREGRDRDKRGGGNRDSYSRPESRDRDRDRDRERDRDRSNRSRDSSPGYGSYRNKNSDRNSFGGGDHRDGGAYGKDSHHQPNRGGSSWNQSYSQSGLGHSSDRSDYGSDSAQKTEKQRRRKSKWDQPGEEDGTDINTKSDSNDRFGGSQSQQRGQGLFNQPPPGFPNSSPFPGPPPFSTSSTQAGRGSSVSLSTSPQNSKANSQFDVAFSRPPPPLLGNLKSEFPPASSSAGSGQSDVKVPASSGGDGLLGQGPGPRPLIPGLQGAGQFRPRGSFPGPPPFRPQQSGGNEPGRPPSGDGSPSSPSKGFSPDLSTAKKGPSPREEDGNQPAPKPLIKPENEDGPDGEDRQAAAGGGLGGSGGNLQQLRGGPGKPGIFPTPSSPDFEGGPPHQGPFRPRGPPGLMGRFPGHPNGPPPQLGGPGMLGPGPPHGIGPRPPRGGPLGPRGPPLPGGPMGGPPRGHMGGGPPRGPRGPGGPGGPGPWNQNRPPRFGPRGPQGPLRPLFDGPPGRWPRPPR